MSEERNVETAQRFAVFQSGSLLGSLPSPWVLTISVEEFVEGGAVKPWWRDMVVERSLIAPVVYPSDFFPSRLLVRSSVLAANPFDPIVRPSDLAVRPSVPETHPFDLENHPLVLKSHPSFRGERKALNPALHPPSSLALAWAWA